MATSGTVGTTVIDTATLLEHAVRRIGLPSSLQTPEWALITRNNLYLLLTSLVNRGVNLWCIDKQIVGMNLNRTKYTLPTGTIDTLNITRRTTTRLTPTATTSSAGGTTANLYDGDISTIFTQASANGEIVCDMGSAMGIVTVGLLAASSGTVNYTFSTSDDNVTYTTVLTTGNTTAADRSWNWFDIDPTISARYLKIAITGGATMSLRELYLASDGTEIVMTRMNRDDFVALPQKHQANEPINYWIDRQLTPVMYVWPQPSNIYTQIVVWRQRQVQDIGTLTNEIEIPVRWYEAVIWQLASRLAFEIPGVEGTRIKAVQQMADKYLYEAEMEERDNSPTYIYPSIRVYTT